MSDIQINKSDLVNNKEHVERVSAQQPEKKTEA